MIKLAGKDEFQYDGNVRFESGLSKHDGGTIEHLVHLCSALEPSQVTECGSRPTCDIG